MDISLGCCWGLFLFTAWLRSTRVLRGRLRYTVPLPLLWRFPCIRWYWVSDLALSAVAFVSYLPVAGLPGKLFEDTLAATLTAYLGVSNLSYPLAAVLLGFLWPQISAVGITIQEGQKQGLSLARLRDYFLGGPAIQSINSKLHVEVASYVERVVDAATADDSGPLMLQAIGLPASVSNDAATRHELRQTLLKRAEEDFESLYLSVIKVRMLPVMDRRRPLMMVPNMTSQEEEKLYGAGIETVRALIRGVGAAAGLPQERLMTLRRNARRLVTQQIHFGLGLVGIVVVVVAIGSLSSRLYYKEPVKPGSFIALAEDDGN
jgi:hypothetical protein